MNSTPSKTSGSRASPVAANTLTVTEMTHARLAPSAAKRWLSCTASVAYCEQNRHRIPEDTGSDYSREGTQAHEWAQLILTGALNMEDIPEVNIKPLTAYVSECNKHTGERLIEESVPLFYDEGEGIVDYGCLTESALVVRDLKWGQGTFVPVEENPQLWIYALSIADKINAEGIFTVGPDTEINLGVVMPRYAGSDDPVQTWSTTLRKSLDFRSKVLEVSQDIRDGKNLVFAPSEDACRWCPAKGFCDARRGQVEDFVDLTDASKMEIILPQTDDTRLVEIYAKRKQIKAFLEHLEDYLTARALDGNPAEGTKIVMGREGNRQYVDHDKADTFLSGQGVKAEDRYAPRVLKSPAQIEKLLPPLQPRGQSRWENLVQRAPGKPVLALLDDKRPAVNPATLTEGFEDLTEGEDEENIPGM